MIRFIQLAIGRGALFYKITPNDSRVRAFEAEAASQRLLKSLSPFQHLDSQRLVLVVVVELWVLWHVVLSTVIF